MREEFLNHFESEERKYKEANIQTRFFLSVSIPFVKYLFKVDEILNILIRLRKDNGKRKFMKMKT